MSYERGQTMFRKIVVAYNESPESQRAFVSAIKLAKSLNAELLAVTAMADLPAYTAFAGVADSSITRVLEEDREKFYKKLLDQARAQAESYGIELRSHLVEGRQVEAIVGFLHQQKADLLVIGLHQRDLHIARLWSTVYELAQDAPCSVLGVH
jgi:nucleotide-binding universal stress UspA family protein